VALVLVLVGSEHIWKYSTQGAKARDVKLVKGWHDATLYTRHITQEI
jgi:hypothetical protein